MVDIRQINAKKILPKKRGRRVLVYPACGSDNDWIRFLYPDEFIGIDLEKSDSNPFNILGYRTKSILLSETDAIIPPEIPKADEVVLLLKCFDWIRYPDRHFSELTQEVWKKYQEENLTSLKKYLQRCEESASRKVFVVDLDGYESVIVPQGYHKLLSLTPTIDCPKPYDFCSSQPCERARLLFDCVEVEKDMPGYACNATTRTELIKDEILITRDYSVTVPILITYVKEKHA